MLSKIKLHWQILIALIFAVAFGYFAPDLVQYVSWMGVIFLRGLNMVVVPLILSSIISGVASIGGGSNLGRLGIKTLSYYIITSLIAILVGLFFVNLFQPGVGANLGTAATIQSLPTANTSVSDILIRTIPDNIFDAMATGQLLPVIFFAILFGAFLTQIPQLNVIFINTSLFQDCKESTFCEVFIAMYRNYNRFSGFWVVIQLMAAICTFKVITSPHQYGNQVFSRIVHAV